MKNEKNEIKISDFLNSEYRDYSMYTIEQRAIPSLVDSFKAVNRKIVYTSTKTIRNISNKVSTLAGNVIVLGKFHHGNVSCEDAIVVMAQDFKNNLPLFERIGQFGSLKAPFASASRYISVKLSNIFDMIYKDDELLIHKIDENDVIEPYFYLPIIATVLVNGGSGVAVGHASNILNREPKLLIKDSISYLKGGKIGKLNPHINGFNGTFTVDENNHKKWYIKGSFNIENTTTVNVTELPPSMTYEKFEEHLNELNDKKLISNWENKGKGKGVINYLVKYNRESLSTMSDVDIDKMLKLTDQVTENFTVLDEFGKLKIFDSAQEILKYFLDFRLIYYDKRKEFQLSKIKVDIFKLDEKYKFVKAVVDGKIIINNKKKDDIIKQIESLKISMIDNNYDYLLSMPIYSLSKEKLEDLSQQIKDKKVLEKEIKNSIPKEVYINELEELYKKLK